MILKNLLVWGCGCLFYQVILPKFSLFVCPLKDVFIYLFIWQAEGHIKDGKSQIIYLEYHKNLVL